MAASRRTVYKHYIYSDLSGDPLLSLVAFELPENATAGELLDMIMEVDPFEGLGPSDVRMFKSKDALCRDDHLKHEESLSGLGTGSEPILVVPFVYSEVKVVLERQKRNGNEKVYEKLGWCMCRLVSDHLDAKDLKKLAASLGQDTRRGFILNGPSGLTDGFPLREETAGGLYKLAINEAFYRRDRDEQGATSNPSRRCLHVILVDEEYYDYMVNLSSDRVDNFFPHKDEDGKLSLGGSDLLTLSESSLPRHRDISIEQQLVSSAELVLFNIMRFPGQQNGQLSRSLASTTLYTAMQLATMVPDAKRRATGTQTGGRMQQPEGVQQAVTRGGEHEGQDSSGEGDGGNLSDRREKMQQAVMSGGEVSST